jgi:nickel/cobalt transporter (NicO) family protein
VRRQLVRGFLVAAAAVSAPLASAAPAAAHPLGNFTVNAAAALTLSPGAVRVDYVLDLAEIPTFQERSAIDADGDGRVEDPERSAWALRRAETIRSNLSVSVDGRPVPLRIAAASMTLRSGQGGLDVLRLEASLLGTLRVPRGRVVFRDDNDGDRVGWREVSAVGSEGVAVGASSVPMSSPSDGLREYPEDLLSSPPSVRMATFTFGPGRQAAPAFASGGGSARRPAGAEGPLAELVARADLSLPVVVLALAAAAAFGALHALAPGHGKTVAAAYLIGTRSRVRQAVSVGGAVAVMHTASVLVLAGVLLFVRQNFPAERLYPWMGLAAGGAAVALGAGLLVGRLRHHHPAEPGHGHDHPPFSGRGLAALALSGGLLPSPTAVVVLLAAASLDRLALGLGMVATFGLGLASSLSAVGVLAVRARTALGRRIPVRVASAMPAAGAGVILAVGAAVAVRAFTQL